MDRLTNTVKVFAPTVIWLFSISLGTRYLDGRLMLFEHSPSLWWGCVLAAGLPTFTLIVWKLTLWVKRPESRIHTPTTNTISRRDRLVRDRADRLLADDPWWKDFTNVHRHECERVYGPMGRRKDSA